MHTIRTYPNRPYDLLVFDWDGTLIDSTSTIAACIQAACVAIGEPKPALNLAKYVIGLGLREALMLCAPNCTPEKYPTLLQQYRTIVLSQDSHLCLFEGVKCMLDNFIAQGYILAVATGKNRLGLDRVLQEYQLGYLFQATRTADETESKPSPRMLFEIVEALNISAQRTLMIGDTTHDIHMAHNAGMDSFAVAQGAHGYAELVAAKPTCLVRTINELPTWLDSFTQ